MMNSVISHLCSELAVSRAQLYRKFKSLSNKTIIDYFKSLRLYKAKELFLTTDLNVTEVTFTVGFKSLAYFSREFTREFGISPSEFTEIIILFRSARPVKIIFETESKLSETAGKTYHYRLK